MPVYEYEGKFYELPTGVNNEEAIAKIRSYLGTAQAPVTPAEPAPQRSLGEEGLRQLGLTARAGIQAFTAPATAVLEAGRGAFNLASQALGSEQRLPSFYQEQAKGLSAIGLPEPETALERAVGSGTEAMAGTGAIARMLPNVPSMAANLQRQIPAAGAAGLAAQPTAEAVKGYTGSDLAATIAAVGVGALTAAGAGKTISAIEQRQIPLQTAAQVRERASRAYTEVENAGITLKDSSVKKMLGDVRSNLDDANMIPGSPEADYINASLSRIESIIAQNPQMSFTTLEKVRGILNNLKTNKDPNIRRLGGVAVTQADNFITGLTSKDVASESELIRRGFINIAASKEKMKLFTNEEKNIIRSVAEGGPLDPLLTFASQFSPLRSKLAAAGGAFAATQAPVTTGVVAGGGLLADYAQSVMRRRAAIQASNRIASGETTPAPESLAYRGLLSTALNPPLE